MVPRVQVLAENPRLITSVVQVPLDGLRLREIALAICQQTVVVNVLARKDRCARRAAHRSGREGILEVHSAVREQPTSFLHHAHRSTVPLIIGEDHKDVRSVSAAA